MPDGIEIKVKTRGPLFDRRGPMMVRRTIEDIEEDVGEHAAVLVHRRLNKVLKNPTGRFQSTIRSRHGHGGTFVDGEGTVYGRWLEGVTSRNATTRFKGYHTFRIVAQQVDRDAENIADRHIDRLARRL